MSSGVSFVLENMETILRTDGGALEILGLDQGVLKLRYTPGVNEECPECVFSPEGLRELLIESLKLHAPDVADVEMV